MPPNQALEHPPLANITNLNTDTLILNGPTDHESLNSAYVVRPAAKMRAHLTLFHTDPACPPASEAIHNVYELPRIECAVRYLHAAAGFPTKATWLKIIHHGNYLTWTLITINNGHKYFPESEETQKGHMHNQRQGIRSTKQRIHTTMVPTEATATSAREPSASAADLPLPINKPDLKQHYIFVTSYEPKATIYTDQTGQFPQRSIRGNKYQMLLHYIDSNSTWVEPIKNKTKEEMILARQRALVCMKNQCIVPKHQVLDNEISALYQNEIKATNMTFKLVPPDDHCRNLAKKSIQTWKDHFIGVLSGTAASFPKAPLVPIDSPGQAPIVFSTPVQIKPKHFRLRPQVRTTGL